MLNKTCQYDDERKEERRQRSKLKMRVKAGGRKFDREEFLTSFEMHDLALSFWNQCLSLSKVPQGRTELRQFDVDEWKPVVLPLPLMVVQQQVYSALEKRSNNEQIWM